MRGDAERRSLLPVKAKIFPTVLSRGGGFPIGDN